MKTSNSTALLSLRRGADRRTWLKTEQAYWEMKKNQ
jgi:hypothetical protein